MKENVRKKLKSLAEFFLNPKLVLCYTLAWIITNGWAYICLGAGAYYEIGWLSAIAAAYLAILWSPFCFELIVTLAITIFLLKRIFPKDKRTLRKILVYNRWYRLKIRKIKREQQEKKKHKVS